MRAANRAEQTAKFLGKRLQTGKCQNDHHQNPAPHSFGPLMQNNPLFPLLSSQITTQTLCNVGHTPLHQPTGVLSLVTAPVVSSRRETSITPSLSQGGALCTGLEEFYPSRQGSPPESITATCPEVKPSLLKTTVPGKAIPPPTSPSLPQFPQH